MQQLCDSEGEVRSGEMENGCALATQRLRPRVHQLRLLGNQDHQQWVRVIKYQQVSFIISLQP